MPKDDCQSFFKVLTQISPAEETFGWKIFVANQPEMEMSASRARMEDEGSDRHFGGAAGNSLVKLNLTLK